MNDFIALDLLGEFRPDVPKDSGRQGVPDGDFLGGRQVKFKNKAKFYAFALIYYVSCFTLSGISNDVKE